MKQIITGGILLPAILILLYSCGSSRNVSSLSPAPDIQTESVLCTGDTYLNNINIRAVRHFRRFYASATDDKWYVVKFGYMVKFFSGEIPVRVNYNSRGDWLYSIRYYDEKTLPKEVRHVVKSTWYDYAITGVEEINVGNLPIYMVHIHMGSDWKTMQVCDGEMKEYFPPGKLGSNY